MKLISEVSQEVLKQIRYVFTDIDDTLTEDGSLTASAYAAIEALGEVGIVVVPITGRPAGWCDLIARFWPVRGVVGENGAFYFRYVREEKRMERFYVDSQSERERKKKELSALAATIVNQIPACAISADQPYRETDLAIDFAEDVPRLVEEEIQRIVAVFQEAGATAKVSSIHVNGWFGKYDKLSMTKIFANQCLDLNLDTQGEMSIFIGDSPNDAPMFEFFEHSVGVANIRSFKSQLKVPPRYVTQGHGGVGFAEFSRALIAAHRGAGL
ncbi:MAG: HAD-IIB family hydrolase [Arenicellales bacterium]|nr:HAD-IIB family hydrolase [Arenicellales bacterium]